MSSAFFSSTTKNKKKDQRLFPEELNIIYDSKCNVCNLEIEFLRRRDIKLAAKQQQQQQEEEDQHQGRKLRFTDLEDAAGYNPKDPANAGVTYEQGMKSMHAVLANGQVVCGVPVFELAYHQVNLGWLFAVTKIPMIKRIADAAYDVFAKYRTQITRGESVERLIEVYRQKKTLDQQQRKAEDCGVCNKATSKWITFQFTWYRKEGLPSYRKVCLKGCFLRHKSKKHHFFTWFEMNEWSPLAWPTNY